MTAIDMATNAVVVTAPVVNFIIGMLIPLVTGLLTHINLSSKIKFMITLVLNAAAALITTNMLSDGTAVLSYQALFTGMYSLIVSLIAYHRVYKKANLTSSTPDGKLAPNHGIGAPS